MLYCAGDIGETAQPPNVAFHPPYTSQSLQQQYSMEGDDRVGPGSGQDKRSSDGHLAPDTSQSAKAFFSQLDWKAGDAGYTAFADESDSESDSSSSDEDEEMFNHISKVDFGQAQPNHKHKVLIVLTLGKMIAAHHTCIYMYMYMSGNRPKHSEYLPVVCVIVNISSNLVCQFI